MYLPHEVELSHTWLFPGILLLPRKHIHMKTGKLAKNLELLAIDPCLETQPLFVYTGWHFQLELPQICPGSVKAKLCPSALRAHGAG